MSNTKRTPKTSIVSLALKHLKPINQTKTKFQCNECERTFQKTLTNKTIQVECPHCGGYDTEPI
jgi:Zn finger protein HypA/HybF involved in hydrogenase expression